ncbi:putative transcription factor DIVARICATA-like [Capsicum annuum]|nr:putative transcription factor DIVARICATA-like [Capsicum annuum]
MTACSFFDMDTDEPILIAGDSKLENLRELAKPVLSYSKETEGIFIRLPNLQRLTLTLKESWDYTTEQYWFPKLDHLTKLDYLRVDFESSNTNDSGPSIATNWSWDFHFPSDLKLLSLWHFIARLSNLKELLVIRTIMQGEEWNMGEEDTFVNLKFLFLDEVTLAKWMFGEKSFPVLEKLVLSGCHKLEEIPSSFGDICSLKIIQLVNNPQLEDSAKKIKQYFEDMGGDELQVLKTLKGREGKVTLEQSWKEEKRMKETERRRKQTTHRSFPNLSDN